MVGFWTKVYVVLRAASPSKLLVLHIEHRIKKSCTWGYKHALVILGLKLGQFRHLGG
jgi:hypothetical protein